MARIKAFLSRAESESLVQHLVAHGGTYGKYLIWCDDNKVPEDKRFTEAYFRTWMQRKRAFIQKTREVHRKAIRDVSIMDRAARIMALEQAFARLDKQITFSEDLDPEVLIKLEEQKRKTLESIAKERGEHGKPPTEDDPAGLGASIGAGFDTFFNRRD